jgi:hypothetical protein
MEEKLLKTAKDDVFLQIAKDLLVAYAEVGKNKLTVTSGVANKGLAGYLCEEFFTLYDSLKKEYLKRL